MLTVLLGMITGLALGLTGGGGTMLAMPFLLYGLQLPFHQAALVSQLAVGIMALVGALLRLRAHQLQLHLGLIFAFAGMLGAPVGTVLAQYLSPSLVISGFAMLSFLVAIRMWRRAHGPLAMDSLPLPDRALLRHAVCRFDQQGHLHLTSRCVRYLIPAGLVTGIISGLFGVGGGFVVVPALVVITGIDIRQATATALLVVAVVSFSAATAALASGQRVDPLLVLSFAGAGMLGVEVGSRWGRVIPQQILQRGFAVILIMIACSLIIIPLLTK